MINLSIDNSVCQISGLSSPQMKELRELMSYTVDPQVSFFGGGHRSPKRYLLDARGSFPTGLLYLAEKYLADTQPLAAYQRTDLRKRPKPLAARLTLNLAHAPYLEQEEASAACVAHGRGILSLPTGTGKSLVASLIIHALQVRTLVVVPSLELKSQLTASLAEAFGRDRVGGLGKTIAVENVAALDPKQVVDYDCVIIDEFHHSGAKTYRQLNVKAWKNVFYKFGLTATPFRSNDNERLLLESVLSQVIYRLDYRTAVEKGYIVPVEAYFVDLPAMQTDAYTWAQVYSQLVVKNDFRNKIITALLLKLHAAGRSALCLVKEIAHGEAISCGAFPFANGQDGESNQIIRDFNSRLGASVAIVGTTGVIGEGVDTKPCEYVLVAGLGKSKPAFMQQVGRAVRRYQGKESAKIVLFRDRSHKFTLRHFNAQVRILRDEYGVTPIKLEVEV